VHRPDELLGVARDGQHVSHPGTQRLLQQRRRELVDDQNRPQVAMSFD